jgi:hypothetical protein
MASKKYGKSKKQSVKKRKRAPAIMQGVGVLSSISFSGTDWETQFIAGLGSGRLLKHVEQNLGYDQTALRTAVKNLNNDTSVGLIVTVGGLITWSAASDLQYGSIKPYMSLIGGRAGSGFPAPGTGMFVHGVSLESFRRNPDRLQKLIQKLGAGATSDMICLLSNPNSFMTPTETAAWVSRSVSANITPNTINARSVYNTAFGDIDNLSNPAIRAVVVSADPCFTETAADLVAEGNRWAQAGANRIICYPTQEYKKYNPTSGSYVLHGPKLKQAYRNLGAAAKQYLKNPTPIPINEEPEDVT